MKKVLIIQTRAGIGDMCIFLPCIHEIAKSFEEYEITLLTQKRTCSEDIFKHDPWIKKIIFLPNLKKLQLNIYLLKLFKKENFDYCFILHYGLRYYLLSKLSGIKKIFSYSMFKKNESIVDRSRKSTNTWLGKLNGELNFIPKIYLNKKILKENQITIGIGGSGFEKKWKIENYIHLIEKIFLHKKKVDLLIAGGQREKDDADTIIKKFKDKNINILSLCDKKIIDGIYDLAKSKLYIGNDTGFMHISGALNVKSYGIFGASPTDYISYNKNIFPITPPGFNNVTFGSDMMNAITPDYVFKSISYLLEE